MSAGTRSCQKGHEGKMPAARNTKRGLKEKILSATSSASGLMGVFSSWTVCHNVCTAAIALLAIIGITVTGMPLLFLQSVAVPFWVAAVALFAILLLLKVRKMGCLSGKMLLLNAGLITAGIPFQAARQFSKVFWLAGGALVLAALLMIFRDRLARSRHGKARHGG